MEHVLDSAKSEAFSKIIEEEDRLSEADEYFNSPPSDIVAFNELRSCSDLFKLYIAGHLEIKPEFQRDVVWSPSSQTRFIDSLTKQLPIPSMCISLDYKTEKRQVVDGLQRISSIIRFISDKRWRLSNLPDIDSKIANKTVDYIRQNHPKIYNRVDNTVVPVTVLRCDLSKQSHQEYLFTIFHRLNTGGQKLNNQEIRNCIYTGTLNDLLKNIVQSDLFTSVFSIDKNRKYRQSNEELVLRILSFSDNFESYKGPLSKHLNRYMSKNRRASDNTIDDLNRKFMDSLQLLYEEILSKRPLPKLSKATTEAVLVSIMLNIGTLRNRSSDELKQKFDNLLNDELFSLEALREGLAARERVVGRLARAREILC